MSRPTQSSSPPVVSVEACGVRLAAMRLHANWVTRPPSIPTSLLTRVLLFTWLCSGSVLADTNGKAIIFIWFAHKKRMVMVKSYAIPDNEEVVRL